MILEQHYLACLSQASYLVGDPSSGRAAVIDPRRDVGLYLERAATLGLRIEHVILTHFHADFVSGHLELQAACGARIHLGARGAAEYEFTPASDGDEIDLGRVRLRLLETPGHTPESISVLAFDLDSGAARAQAVFTGDTLFIGDVGRPDLLASVGVSELELADMLYDSLHGKLLVLPDETLVYPGHGAGSACGKNLSTELVSTIGLQRRANLALQVSGREEFRALVCTGQPDAPPYFAHDADYNRRARPTLDASLGMTRRALAPPAVLAELQGGAQLLDVRPAASFAAGHVQGSLNIGLAGRFAEWAGTLLSRDTPIVIVGDEGQEQEAALRLGRIGFDHVAGHVQGGVQAIRSTSPELVQSTPLLDPQEFAGRLRAAGAACVVDVRRPAEWETGHLEGALNIPAHQLLARLDELPRGRPLAVHCASGFRSSAAASLLRRAGFADVSDLAGGIAAWRAAGLPTQAHSAGAEVGGSACGGAAGGA